VNKGNYYKSNTTEKEFQSQIKDLAKIYGWRYYHTFLSKWSVQGFPDCVLVKPPRVIFAELKSNKGKVNDKQHEWLDDLSKCPGVEVYLWRPDDIEALPNIFREDVK